MMNAREMSELIGQRANIRLGDLLIAVTIADVKQAYGRNRYQVMPVAGEGMQWVETVYMKGGN